jgi:hypothetical protein
MGWLNEFIETIKGEAPKEFTYIPTIPAPGVEGIGQQVSPDECYIELWLLSSRLERGRKFATRFHGLVYSFVTLSRQGTNNAKLAAISKPQELARLDPNSLDRVIVINKQMMGSTAYRGGPVSLELGLFSIRDGNLLTPILDYVTEVSTIAGISYVGTIKPFLPLITKGMDLIAGQTEDTALEVGIDTSLQLATSCVAAIIAKPKASVDASKISLDKDNRLLYEGKPLDCGYIVFSLKQRKEKPDYGEIPELKERFDAFLMAIRSGRQTDAKDASTAFCRTAIASPDLIPKDAQKLCGKVKEMYEAAFLPMGVATTRKLGIKAPKSRVQVTKLSEIGLYD